MLSPNLPRDLHSLLAISLSVDLSHRDRRMVEHVRCLRDGSVRHQHTWSKSDSVHHRLCYLELRRLATTCPTGPPGHRLGAGLGLSASIPVRNKRLETGFPAGSVILVLGEFGGGAGRTPNGECRRKRASGRCRRISTVNGPVLMSFCRARWARLWTVCKESYRTVT